MALIILQIKTTVYLINSEIYNVTSTTNVKKNSFSVTGVLLW